MIHINKALVQNMHIKNVWKEDIAILKQYAKQHELNFSDVVRQIIHEFAQKVYTN